MKKLPNFIIRVSWLFICSILCLSDTGDVRAQASVNRAIERDIEKFVGNYLDKKLFLIVVSSVEDESEEVESKSIPYLPNPNKTVSKSDRDIENLILSLSSLEIKIVLDRSVNRGFQRTLAQILNTRYPLSRERGDKLRFLKADLKPAIIEETVEPVQTTQQPSQAIDNPAFDEEQFAKINNAQKKIDELENERNDLKMDLTLTKTLLDKAEREAMYAKALQEEAQRKKEALEAQALKERLNNDQAQKPAPQGQQVQAVPASPAVATQIIPEKEFKDQKSFEDRVAQFSLAIAMIISFFVLGFVLFSGSTSFGNKFEKASQNIARGIMELRPSSASAGYSGGESANVNVNRSIGDPGNDLSAKHNRVEDLKKDILENYKSMGQMTQTIVISKVFEDLNQAKTVERAVCAMELLGVDEANRVFKMLGTEQKRVVLNFLSKRNYSIDKIDLMIDVAENLKSLLFAGDFKSLDANLSDELRLLLMRFNDESISELTKSLDEDTVARLLIYFDSSRISAIASLMHPSEKDHWKSLTSALLKMPYVSDRTDLDGILIKSLENIEQRNESIQESRYLGFYKEFFENIQGDLAEYLVQNVSKANQVVSDYLSDNLITFQTYFKLAEQYQEKIVAELGLQDLGVLFAVLPDNLLSGIRKYMEQQKIDIVYDEVQIIRSLSKTQLDKQFSETKQKVIDLIKREQGPRPLGDLLDIQAESQYSNHVTQRAS